MGAVGVPEDPISDAVVPGLDVADHVALADLPAYRKGLGIDWRKVRSRLAELDEHTQLRVAYLMVLGRNAIPWSLVGFPALSLPCGTAGGLPVGLQLVAPPGREDLLVAVGTAAEAAVA